MFPALREKRVADEFDYDDQASERVIADSLGWVKTTKYPTSTNRTVHMKCAVPPQHLQSKTNRPSFPVPSPGRSVTQARRLYVSSLANFRVSDPIYGAAHKDVHCRQPSQGWRVWRAPRTPFRSLHGKIALRRRYRALCHARPFTRTLRHQSDPLQRLFVPGRLRR